MPALGIALKIETTYYKDGSPRHQWRSVLEAVRVKQPGRQVVSDMPIPSHFGVFALHNGQLTELQGHPQSSTIRMTFAGQDLWNELSGIHFPDGNVQFVIFVSDISGFIKIPVRKVARVMDQLDLGLRGKIQKREPMQTPRWYVLDKSLQLNVAPVPEHPRMMVRAFSNDVLPPGLWALNMGGVLYDFVIQGDTFSEDDCVNRYVNISGPTYKPCDRNAFIKYKKEVFAAFAARGDNRLFDAIQQGDLANVRDALAQGADVHARDAWGNTPLHKAVLNDIPGIAEALLNQGADVAARSVLGYTPLHGAKGRNIDILLDYSADIHATDDSEGSTPLHSAALE